MDWLTIFGLAVALAMDAFAVALGVGINLSLLTGRHHRRRLTSGATLQYHLGKEGGNPGGLILCAIGTKILLQHLLDS
jgi:putative Mn2+ efflux pump MntP